MTETELPDRSHSVKWGKTEIGFSLHYSDRKTLAIHVHPDGQVSVDAPVSASIEEIYGKVKKRATWILRQQRQFAAYPPALPARRYVTGETHRYLGRQYRLKVLQGEGEQVKLLRGCLQVETRGPDDQRRVKALLQAWYREKARLVFTERYEHCRTLVAKFGIRHESGFQLRLMPKRWGSCTRSGNILLNPELVAAPKDCIEYVITHELCHLKEPNHSQAFYRLLTAAMKDWEVRRQRLNEIVEVRFV